MNATSPERAVYGWADRGSEGRAEWPVLERWVPQGSRVLDVGCGDGGLGARLIANRGARVDGLELDPEGVAKAVARGVRAVVGDVDQEFAAPETAYDVAICNVTLMMVYRPAFVLGEMLRLAPIALVSFPNVAHWLARAQLVAGRFPRRPLYGHPWWETRHIHLFSWADFGDLVRASGARITASEHFGGDSRTPSAVARAWPNLFAGLCLARVERTR